MLRVAFPSGLEPDLSHPKSKGLDPFFRANKVLLNPLRPAMEQTTSNNATANISHPDDNQH